MKKENKYAVMGLKALKRAAAKVAEDARKNNYKIPIWRNGRIEHVIPEAVDEVETPSSSKQIKADRLKETENQTTCKKTTPNQ